MWYPLEVIKQSILIRVPKSGFAELIIDNYSHVEISELRTLAL